MPWNYTIRFPSEMKECVQDKIVPKLVWKRQFIFWAPVGKWSCRHSFIMTCGISVQFSHSVMSDTLWPIEPQHARPPCPSPLPESTQTHVHWLSDAIQPSHALSSTSPPVLNLSQHQGLFKWGSSFHQVAKILEFQLYFFLFYFIFKLYNIVLVLPNIEMNPPQVYLCSPSWTLLPPPSPYPPSGSSQCTSPKHPVSCIEPGLVTRFIHDVIHVSICDFFSFESYFCLLLAFSFLGIF